MKTLLLISIAACLIAFLASCASPAITPKEHARAMQAHPAAPADKEWPDPDKAKWKQGSFPTLDNVRMVRPDMNKDQVRELLGWPHFREGLWGVQEWNYLFNLRTGQGDEYRTCQYMVRFDDTPLSTGSWWRKTDCAALANPAPVLARAATPAPQPLLAPAPVPVPVSAPTVTNTPVPPPALQKVSIPADGLFRFNRSGPEDILPEGRARIEQLARDIQINLRTLQAVTVIGYTDRLGTDTYNQKLSQARADTARELLVKNGIAANKVQALGRGKERPVVECEGLHATPNLVRCLQPNRRVEIEVLGSP